MKLKVPFYKQKNIYYCGPATMQMILEYHGKKQSQKKLAKELKTNKLKGTPHKNMVKFILKNNFNVYTNKNSNIKELKKFINLKFPVIVNYFEPVDNEIHYAVVIGYEKDYILLNDPWHGKDLKLKNKFFTSRWLDTKKYKKYNQGIIVVWPN